jgi:hypothetical protein
VDRSAVRLALVQCRAAPGIYPFSASASARAGGCLMPVAPPFRYGSRRVETSIGKARG